MINDDVDVASASAIYERGLLKIVTDGATKSADDADGQDRGPENVSDLDLSPVQREDVVVLRELPCSPLRVDGRLPGVDDAARDRAGALDPPGRRGRRRRRMLALVTARESENEQPGFDDLYRVGTAAIVHKMIRVPDGTLRVLVQGLGACGSWRKRSPTRT